MSYHTVQRQDSDGENSVSYLSMSMNVTDISQLDAGQHPAYDGLAALPYFDEFDLSKVDVLLISQ